MNPFFALGLFDNPWIVIAIVVGSMVANWLSKRRQEKQSEGSEPASPSGKAPGEFDLEETLRRLMGEESPVPAPPPPIPQPVRRELPARTVREKAESRQPVRQTKPPLGLPPLTTAQSGLAVTVVGEQQREAARRFEQLNEQGRHPAVVVGHGRSHASAVGRRVASPWHNRRKARQAFVASLVFAPPKGLEP